MKSVSIFWLQNVSTFSTPRNVVTILILAETTEYFWSIMAESFPAVSEGYFALKVSHFQNFV
jgi:hypothetical protein